jgi:hypothetical protein
MIGEANLIKIMRAADHDDPDDVAIRKLMVSALKEWRSYFTELLDGSTPWIGSLPTAAGALSTAGFAERSYWSGQRAIQPIHLKKS